MCNVNRITENGPQICRSVSRYCMREWVNKRWDFHFKIVKTRMWFVVRFESLGSQTPQKMRRGGDRAVRALGVSVS